MRNAANNSEQTRPLPGYCQVLLALRTLAPIGSGVGTGPIAVIRERENTAVKDRSRPVPVIGRSRKQPSKPMEADVEVAQAAAQRQGQ